MIAASQSQPSPFQFYVGVASRRSLARSSTHSRSKLAERTIPAQTGEAEETAEEGRGGDRSSGIYGGRSQPRPRQRAGSSHTHAPHACPKSLHSLPTYLRATCVCMRNQPKVSNCRCYASNTSTTYSHLPALSYGSASPRHVRASLRPTVASSNNISGPSAN